MKAITTNVVVVGVGNSTPSAAVDWAATEAGRRGATLQLLMAYDASIALPNRGGAIPPDPFTQGRAAGLEALAALQVSAGRYSPRVARYHWAAPRRRPPRPGACL